MNLSISHLAYEMRVSALALIKLAKKTGVGYRPNLEQVEMLVRHLSNYYNLENAEIRTLHDYIESDSAKLILKEISPFITLLPEDETNKILHHVSEKLYDAMPESELKNKIKPETLYETIMNLGVVKIFRTGFGDPDDKKLPPVSLLSFDKGIYLHLIKAGFIKEMEVHQIRSEDDFDGLELKIAELRKMLEGH